MFAFQKPSRFVYKTVDYQSFSGYKSLRETVSEIPKLDTEKDSQEEAKNKIQAAGDAAVSEHGTKTKEAEKEVVKERGQKEAAAKAKMREELGAEPMKDSKEYAKWKQQWDALWQQRIVPLQQEEATKKGDLWREHDIVKQKIYSMRDIAKKQVNALYTAHKSAKEEIKTQVDEALKMELDREDLRELEEMKKIMLAVREGGFFGIFGPGYDPGEIDYGDSKVNGVDIDDSDIEGMTQWIVALNSRDEAGKTKMKVFIDRLKKREESSPEFDKRLFFEDVKLELLSEMGQGISNKEARMLAMGSEPAKLIDEIAASDKLPKNMKGILLGKLLKSGDAAHVREIYGHMAAIGMDEDVSVEKAYATFLALEYAQYAEDYRYWVTSYEGFKTMTGATDPTCESLTGLTSAVEMKNKVEEFKTAYKKLGKEYRISKVKELKESPALVSARDLYKHFEVPFGYDKELDELATKDVVLAEFVASVDEYKARAESVGDTPKLRENAAGMRDNINEKIAKIQHYQELREKYGKYGKVKKLPTIEAKHEKITAESPVEVKQELDKSAPSVQADYKIVEANIAELEAATKPQQGRGGGGGQRVPGGGGTPSPKPQQAPPDQPKKKVDPSELVAEAEVKWKWKDKQPKGYDVENPVKDKPEWTTKFEENKEKNKTGWVELRRGDARVLAKVEQNEGKSQVKIEYYEQEKKQA